MALIGFRHPQFSEDVAYLPPWLAKLQDHALIDHIRRSHSLIDQDYAVHEGCGFINTTLLSNEDERYTACHLIISGSNDDPASHASSQRNMIHFQLQLSSDTGSRIGSQPCMLLQETDVHQIHHTTKGNAFPAEHCRSARNLHLDSEPLQNDFLHHDSLRSEIKTVDCPTSDDINDVLRLSVAASEAVTVHETLASTPSSDASPAATVLEIVIRLKQAKIDNLVVMPGFTDEEADGVDSLSDLDDFVMADAFEDVGLSSRLHVPNILISPVYSTHISECFGSRCHCTTQTESVVQETIPGSFLLKEGIGIFETEPVVEQNLCLKFGENDCHMLIESSAGTVLSQSIGPVKKLSKEVSFECRANANSYYLFTDSECSEEKMDVAAMVNFHSRWFGGWTGNFHADLDSPLCVQDKVTRNGSELAQLSFLPGSCNSSDVNYVDREEKAGDKNSEIPVLLNHCDSKLNEKVLFSNDIMGSSILSLHGSLCSAVPCSINSDCAGVTNPQNSMGGPMDVNEYLNVEFNFHNSKALTIFNGKTSDATVKRCSNLLTSAREYDEDMGVDYTSDFVNLKDETNCGENSKAAYEIPLDAEHITRSMFFSPTEQKLVGILNRAKPLVSEISFLQKRKTSESFTNREFDVCVPTRKRVCCLDPEILHPQKKINVTNFGSGRRRSSKLKNINRESNIKDHQGRKMLITYCFKKYQKELIFQGLEFLLTGFRNREGKKIEQLICKYGGRILVNVPSCALMGKRTRSFCQLRPIVVCSKKLESSKFLYGCAVGAFILKPKWLLDSIVAGNALPLKNKYTVLSRQYVSKPLNNRRPFPLQSRGLIFYNLGIMLHGRHRFCRKFFKIVKHGGGQVFRNIQLLVKCIDRGNVFVGAIVIENEARISRHLKQCAFERNIPVRPASWIIQSLHAGKLLSLSERCHST